MEGGGWNKGPENRGEISLVRVAVAAVGVAFGDALDEC